jgi:hypothetical protein
MNTNSPVKIRLVQMLNGATAQIHIGQLRPILKTSMLVRCQQQESCLDPDFLSFCEPVMA